MRQKQAETKIIEAIHQPHIKGLYNTAYDHKEARSVLLNAIHRECAIPKFQIVNYLNKKGFNYEGQVSGLSQD